MLATAALLAAPAIPASGVYPVFVMKRLCFAIFACASNLLLGFSGMLSFGQAAYFSSGAYVTGWLITAHGGITLAAVADGMLGSTLLGASSAHSRSAARVATSRWSRSHWRSSSNSSASRRRSLAAGTGCRASRAARCR